MITWQNQLKGDSVRWLMESDSPSVRYLTLRDVLDTPPEDPRLRAACIEAHTQGKIAVILAGMNKAGLWVKSGSGYNPKYRSAVWSLLTLAQLGASAAADERIATACGYILDHALTSGGHFTVTGAPSGTVDCLQGNLCWAILELGYDDPRLANAFEWMARSVTGEGVAPMEDQLAPLRYYAYKCGALFACGVNGRKPCAWGAVKVMLAFARLPQEKHTPLIDRAIQHGVDFLLGIDPATARYPTRDKSKPSSNWWKFGFPVFYITDLLQLAEALTQLGYAHDPRLANTLALIRDKQDEHGRWALEYDYAGKTWTDFGQKKQPNPWVTLRSLRVLKAAAE